LARATFAPFIALLLQLPWREIGSKRAPPGKKTQRAWPNLRPRACLGGRLSGKVDAKRRHVLVTRAPSPDRGALHRAASVRLKSGSSGIFLAAAIAGAPARGSRSGGWMSVERKLKGHRVAVLAADGFE